MTLFTRLSLTGFCDTCRQEFFLQLDGMEQKMAISNARAWVVHGHFCPGSPESNELDLEAS